MPVEVVDLDLTAETGAIPQPTFTDVGLVTTTDTAPSGAEYNELNRYSDPATVADEHGEGSDAHVASQAVAQMGASYWYVLALEAVENTEELAADATTELSESPILGTPEPTTGGSEVIGFTSSLADADAVGDNEDIVINTSSGEAYNDSDTSVQLTYYAADYTKLSNLGENVNRVGVANRKFGVENIGTLDALATYAGGNNIGVVAAGIDGRTVADDETALAEYHETFSFAPSGDMLAVAHKSSDAVESYILGQLATNDPWFDPFYDGDGYPFANELYDPVLVGDPATAGTFEGGDSEAENGNVNVVINKAGTQVLSNSVTTAGSASNYQFFDVGRTQDFLAAEVRRALTSLRLREDQIPFTKAGRAQIQNVISNTINQYVGGGGPLASFSVTIPPVAQLTDSQKANREWAGIDIEVTLAGNVHQFSVTLNLTV
jgi:hypothetical protein